MPRGRSPWSLRRRIMVGAAAVVSVALVATGAISIAIVESSVTSVVDRQLFASTTAMSASIEKMRANHGPTEGGGRGFEKPLVDFVGHGSGTIIALAQGGRVVDSANFTSDEAVPLSDAAATELLAAAVPEPSTPATVSLDGLGEFHVTSRVLSNGDSAIVGVSLAIADQAVAQHTTVLLIVALLAILVTAITVIVVTRVALRPLDRLAATADEVSTLPLEKGEVSISKTIGPLDTDPRTEAGRVGEAMQRMIDHVDTALAVRESTDRRMRRFVTDASHELRTPLAAILGYAELTRQEAADLPELTEYSLARIESEATRMSSLVAELLLLARLDEGQDLRIDDVDLADLVVNAVSDARASAPGYEWSISVPHEPVMVRGDHERLHQVLANLLSNARVHTPEGTHIAVSLGYSDSFTELTVTDSGPGIDPALVPELFQRFSRADESRSRSAGSTGLGLAIVATIVESHNGEVHVESVPGKTTVTVRFPASGTMALAGPD
ncbi:two-component system sensor histidine kinase TrcS [Microbacteriaceae bacterium SG_E_30_P1]|uniref:histidine kinase n=1 Tax=Antiquaquibacter oligotrophicus TaxID=2880260 RepID=A0ABT6KQ47_9MICO|nr:ATP-binding protein [Antiquaquibacter oligotrophicus]MDH6182106.1 two-component system sensor histidine kinase TrcS [Antiquaquibacter oligotrophicus]UDF12230.1 HAMP domain-containing histidine kinase [Antiquaquibacter oligotrophicus]